jgi:hypothetical protein
LGRLASRRSELAHPWLHNFPNAWEFPYTIGTNASFLRQRLVDLGGFDEEFEYYLDETDLCCRIVDAGWIVKNIDDGFVYHKFLPSDIRSENRATRSYFAVLKNKCYFAFKRALPLTSHYSVWQNLVEFAALRRADVEGQITGQYLIAADLAQFDKDKEAAYDLGFERWERNTLRTRPVEWFGQLAQPFLSFPTKRPRRTSSTSASSARSIRLIPSTASAGSSISWPPGWPTGTCGARIDRGQRPRSS